MTEERMRTAVSYASAPRGPGRKGLSFLWRCVVPALFLAACLGPSVCEGYQVPERLDYDISWMGVRVGSASLSTARKDSGQMVSATAKTKKWVSLFYEVDDELSVTRGPAGPAVKGGGQRERPLAYRVRLREGAIKVEHAITFDHQKKRAVFQDGISGRKAVHRIEPEASDLLSALFLVRSMPLEVGKQYTLSVADNGSVHSLSLRVVRREQISTVLGARAALVVQVKYSIAAPGLMYLPGDLHVWLTDDGERIPVLIEKQIIIPPGSRIPAVLRPKIESAMGSARMALTK